VLHAEPRTTCHLCVWKITIREKAEAKKKAHKS
jgi:hypothetical protein